MSETTVATLKKKGGGAKAKKASSATGNHPKVAEMVSSAISTLKERNGSSLQAIKKYISTAYKVDVEKLAPFIRRYLKSAVVNGKLIQTKGKGASGSFKLGGKGDGGPATKTAPTRKAKPAAPKKVASKPKKMASEKKKTAKPKSAKKASKAKRSPTKAKTPKPKKAAGKAAKGKASSAPKQPTAIA